MVHNLFTVAYPTHARISRFIPHFDAPLQAVINHSQLYERQTRDGDPRCRLCPYTGLAPGQIIISVKINHSGKVIPINEAITCQTSCLEKEYTTKGDWRCLALSVSGGLWVRHLYRPLAHFWHLCWSFELAIEPLVHASLLDAISRLTKLQLNDDKNDFWLKVWPGS